MQRREMPLGMLRRDDILNALLAIWKSRRTVALRDPSQFNQDYEIGFEEGLEAIAQFTGLAEEFEVGKAGNTTRTKSRLDPAIKTIEGNITSVEY